MNLEKATKIALKSWCKPDTEKKEMDMDLLRAFSKIIAEETTDAFLRGVKFGKGYKEEKEDEFKDMNNPFSSEIKFKTKEVKL